MVLGCTLSISYCWSIITFWNVSKYMSNSKSEQKKSSYFPLLFFYLDLFHISTKTKSQIQWRWVKLESRWKLNVIIMSPLKNEFLKKDHLYETERVLIFWNGLFDLCTKESKHCQRSCVMEKGIFRLHLDHVLMGGLWRKRKRQTKT